MPASDFNDRDGLVETSIVLNDGAVAQQDFTNAGTLPSRLLLRRPDLSTAQLIADVDVVGPDVSRVRSGLSARVRHHAWDERRFKGRVARLYGRKCYRSSC